MNTCPHGESFSSWEGLSQMLEDDSKYDLYSTIHAQTHIMVLHRDKQKSESA